MSKNSKKNVNPFGDTVRGQWGPSDNVVYDTKGGSVVKSILGLFLGIAIFLLIVAVVVTNFYGRSLRDSAVDSMRDVNAAISSMDTLVQGTPAIQKEVADYANGLSDGDEKDLAVAMSNALRMIPEDPYQNIGSGTSDDEAAVAVAPYFLVCDISEQIQIKSDNYALLRPSCNSVKSAGYDFMDKSSRWSDFSDSILSSISFVGSKSVPNIQS